LQADAVNTTRRMEANDKFLQGLIASTQNEQKVAQQKLEVCNAEKTDLLVQLARSDAERVSLYDQVTINSLNSRMHRTDGP
jgi:hypothetical protein